jgi:hypothetical protein
MRNIFDGQDGEYELSVAVADVNGNQREEFISFRLRAFDYSSIDYTDPK